MTEKLLISQQRSWVLRLIRWRWTHFFLICGLTNACLWGALFTYLKFAKPSYTSQWALVLPGASLGVNFNLPEIGQASSSDGSGMGSASYDPRANYEYLFTSEPVLKAASAIAKVSLKEYGKPRIKLLDNTTLMQIELVGKSPKEAHQKSWALYKSITQQLDSLRSHELKQRVAPTQSILESAQKKLKLANERLADYKLQSGLTFPDKINNLSTNLEQLRRQRAETIALEQQARRKGEKLSSDLGVTSQQAAEAFLLKSDQIFQQNLKDNSEATTALQVLLSKFGPNHPKVLKELKRQESAQAALSQRAQFLLEKPADPELLVHLSLNTETSGRDPLFQNLVTSQSELKGLAAQVLALNEQIKIQEKKLEKLAQSQPRLDNLKRDEQIAEAVFASTLAKLDLGRGDVFSAYPRIQIAVEPTIPTQPSAPQKSIIVAGTATSSLFLTLGLILLWMRKPWIKDFAKFVS
jgi:uncharacterized protein involved in exopolysaccharide biosynthesis